MLFRFVVAALVSTLPAFAQSPTPAAAVQPSAPLTVEAFAQLPFVEHAHISPDGSHIAGLFGINGEQSIVIMPLSGDKSASTLLGVPESMRAGSISWVNNDNIVVSLTGLLPVEGDRWYVSRLIAINRGTRKLTRLLWDLRGQNGADILWMPNDGGNDILIAAQNSIYSNNAEFWPEVYRVDVTTGKRHSVLQGRTNVMNWGADNLGNVRIGLGYNDNRLTSRLFTGRVALVLSKPRTRIPMATAAL